MTITKQKLRAQKESYSNWYYKFTLELRNLKKLEKKVAWLNFKKNISFQKLQDMNREYYLN